MTDLFDADVDVIDEEGFVGTDGDIDTSISEDNALDARRRLENLLEERRLREELDDFDDFG